MQIDKTTLQDLSIFHHEEALSIFQYLNFTQTNDGREYLRWMLSKPLQSLNEIIDTQNTIRHLMHIAATFPTTITNGTIMVIDRFYDTPVDSYPTRPNFTSSLTYTIFSKSDYSLTKYSIEHFSIFLQGLQQIVLLLQQPHESNQLKQWSDSIAQIINKPELQPLLLWQKEEKMLPQQVLKHGSFLKQHFKQKALELLDIFRRLDAYLSLAKACIHNQFVFPEISITKQPFINGKGLYHPLLNIPVSYDVTLDKDTNFLFLTGANMAGKSTFIKATGISVYLAHLGMAVPAQRMQLSFFNGIISNINVADNIIKGESYFFNEVQRIKNTIEKISDGQNWLVLIDELFKGTNVEDAMKCSTVVIEGLRKMPNALFILSTHLYEIGNALKQYHNIAFRYFETEVSNDQLVFSYQLKEGISNDRLGYLILRKEGVVQLLEAL